MSLVKLASWASNAEIKDNYGDDRGHWRKHKGKYIGAALAGPIGLTVGALHFDKNRRERDFNNKGENNRFIRHGKHEK